MPFQEIRQGCATTVSRPGYCRQRTISWLQPTDIPVRMENPTEALSRLRISTTRSGGCSTCHTTGALKGLSARNIPERQENWNGGDRPGTARPWTQARKTGGNAFPWRQTGPCHSRASGATGILPEDGHTDTHHFRWTSPRISPKGRTQQP